MLQKNGLSRSSLYFIGNFYEVKSVQFVLCYPNTREISDDDDVDDEVNISWTAQAALRKPKMTQ